MSGRGNTPPPPLQAGARPAPAPTLQVGDIIAGKFRVERLLGRGGMGVVVAATHLELEQVVALKFLLPAASTQPELVTRFAREGKAAAKIRSEHGVKIFDVGSLPTGLPYIVMEYLEGEDLKQLARRIGPLPVDVAVGYMIQATEALAEAHALGIVHRDLKPANFFLTRYPNGEPLIKVLDFGISKAAHSPTEAPLTRDAMVMGSPNYISPEQLTSARSVDARSDIWSLGVVLYHLLTGVKPFDSGSMREFLEAIIQRPHRPIRELRADIPESLAAAIDRCLQKEPQHRFQTALQLAEALAPFGPSRSGAAAPPVVDRADAAPAVLGSEARPVSSTRPPDVSPRTGVLVGVVALLAVAGSGLALTRARAGSPAAEAPQVDLVPPPPAAAASGPALPSPASAEGGSDAAPPPQGSASATAPALPPPAPPPPAPEPPAEPGPRAKHPPGTSPQTHLRQAKPR